MKIVTVLIGVTLASAWGQTIKLPASLERLAAKAEDSFEVTMDKNMLQLASKFLSGKGDEAKTRKALEGLESIYVRSFTFAKEGEYNAADLDAVRAQLQAPAWSRIAGVKSSQHGENIDVFVKLTGNGQFGGTVILTAEPRELTIVNITGTIDPAQLGNLGGQFHIPELSIGGKDRH